MGEILPQAVQPMTSIDSVPGGNKYVDITMVFSRLRTAVRVAARTTEMSSCKNQAVILPSRHSGLTPALSLYTTPFEMRTSNLDN